MTDALAKKFKMAFEFHVQTNFRADDCRLNSAARNMRKNAPSRDKYNRRVPPGRHLIIAKSSNTPSVAAISTQRQSGDDWG